ncbi:hypothetical protein, partial [Streptomyces sp. SID3212]|uniref:hypothetical protein n=1 Tax=Streptomyces sp. SID3212 TaxID=2690259 RepID=UPI001F3E3C2F
GRARGVDRHGGLRVPRERAAVAPCEPAHEPVARQPGLTRRIRTATVREQSDPHEDTPDLPCERPPLIGDSQRDDRKRT